MPIATIIVGITVLVALAALVGGCLDEVENINGTACCFVSFVGGLIGGGFGGCYVNTAVGVVGAIIGFVSGIFLVRHFCQPR
ncbi:hypothetical protein AB0L00_00695 [Actinoallomurus sp. NPDC052308]|uniref:hypothetical protein n=1 Tax=Actinoallomurus sp. NPDC052308 TaxID=3155530 RepID=UPI003430F296